MTKQTWLPLFREFLKYIRIPSKEVAALDERGAPLDLWRSQEMALKTIVRGLDKGQRTFMFGKARQQGISTIFEALTIFWVATHDSLIAAMVVEDGKNKKALRLKIQGYIASFPKNFFGKKFGIETDNDDFMTFTNGSRIDFLSAGKSEKQKNWGEGRGYALAHLSEVSKYGSAEDLASFKNTLATKNPDRLVIYESTSKGFNHWKTMWDEFGNDQFDKCRMFIGWWGREDNRIEKTDPRYKVYGTAEPDDLETELMGQVEKDYGHKISRQELAWYRKQSDDLSVDMEALSQNLPWTMEQSFVASGRPFFLRHYLSKQYNKFDEDPEFYKYRGFRYIMGNEFWATVCEPIYDPHQKSEITLKVWDDPVDDAQYVIGCDPAYGRDGEGDNHCISVWRCFGDKLVQVAEWAEREHDTRQAAWVLSHLAGAYKNVLINPEVNGPGGVLIQELEHLRQLTMISPKHFENNSENKNWDDFLTSANFYLYKKTDLFTQSAAKGMMSGIRQQYELMNVTRDKFVTDKLVIRSKLLVDEMMDVVQEANDHIGAKSAYDDRVFAMALAVRAWNDSLMIPMNANNVMFDDYLKERSGEPVDKASKMINNVIRDYMTKAQEEGENPPVQTHKQYLYERGF